jgi:phage replication-related protein YjqB (UPF0714/DUF867 family)
VSTADVTVEVSDRRVLAARREHCAVDPGTLAAIGRTHHQQVRIVLGADLAIYTVVEVQPAPPPGTVLMGPGGRLRLGDTATVGPVIDSAVTRVLAETEAARQGELIERLCDDGVQRGLIAIAPHGGEIERHTDEQAERVQATLAVSSWLCRGFDGGTRGALDRWHITAADIDPASFPLLDSVMSRKFDHAVAFHGMSGEGVLVGGGANSRALQEEIAAEIRCIPGVAVQLADPDDVLGGNAKSNIVNRLATERGVQIEQSRTVRDEHGRDVADAVAAVYRRHLSTTPAPR